MLLADYKANIEATNLHKMEMKHLHNASDYQLRSTKEQCVTPLDPLDHLTNLIT